MVATPLNYISQENSVVTTLGAGETWTGTGEDVSNYGRAGISIWTPFGQPTTEVRGDEVVLTVANSNQAHGAFAAANRSSAGTTIITAPNDEGSLILTDLIVGADRVNGATVTVQFTDGTDTVVIYATDVTDAPANIGVSFGGRWQGWKDARVELVTVNAVNATVSLGYIKVPQGLPYAEWDSRR